MKNKIIALVVVFLLLFVSCSKKPLKDGVYSAESTADKRGSYAKVELVIKNQQIDNVKFISYDSKGNVKDENYGKNSGNDEFYKKAQMAVKGIKSYEEQINQKKDLNKVDAVSGATESFKQFIEAMELALDKARQ